MKIEIESIAELKELIALFMPAPRAVDGDFVGMSTAGAEQDQPKARKARTKATEPASEPKPEEPAEPAPQPEPEPTTAPEGKAEEPPKEKPTKAKKVTRDDVVQAFRGYIDRFGQKAAMTDVTVLLKRGFDIDTIKAIPDGEDNFKKAIKIVTEAININEFNREAVQ